MERMSEDSTSKKNISNLAELLCLSNQKFDLLPSVQHLLDVVNHHIPHLIDVLVDVGNAIVDLPLLKPTQSPIQIHNFHNSTPVHKICQYGAELVIELESDAWIPLLPHLVHPFPLYMF